MRKILYLLILTVLCISCSSDDENNRSYGNENGNNNPTIDENLIGKWKVEYSKTIKPAQFDEKTGKILYGENALITEYNGDFGELDIFPESGIFD